jgi:hypothetical protein
MVRLFVFPILVLGDVLHPDCIHLAKVREPHQLVDVWMANAGINMFNPPKDG